MGGGGPGPHRSEGCEDQRGRRPDLQRSFRGPRAHGPGSTPHVHVGSVLALGRLRGGSGLRGGSCLPDQLTQELEPGEEELPDYEPACRTETAITGPAVLLWTFRWSSGNQLHTEEGSFWAGTTRTRNQTSSGKSRNLNARSPFTHGNRSGCSKVPSGSGGSPNLRRCRTHRPR